MPPYEMFWSGAKVPLPNPLPSVQRVPAGAPPYAGWSYYDRGRRRICLVPTDWHSRFAVLHETGHCFADGMSKAERQAAARIIGHPGLRWFWGSWNPARHARQPNEENFADWYAACAVGEDGPQHVKLRRLLYEIAGRRS